MSRTSSTRVSVAEASSLLLEAVGPEAKYESHELEPFSPEPLGYLATHELLTIRVRGLGEPLTFFAKSLAQTNNEFDKLVFEEERKFFAELAPRLVDDKDTAEPWAARCHLARDDLLVLEDLRARGFRASDPVEPLSPDQLRSAVTCVASFHAASVLLEERLGQPLGLVYPAHFREKVFVDDGALGWRWLLAGAQVVRAVARRMGLDPSRVSDAYRLVLDRVRPLDGETNVLCHADLWCNNLMFRGQSCRLVDFQMTTYTSCCVDLLQLIHLNTSRAGRWQLEDDLVKLYHQELTQRLGARVPGLQWLIGQMEHRRICGLVTAVQFLPIALLNKRLAGQYSSDPGKLHEYMYTSREDFVLGAMDADDKYRRRLEDAVVDLIEFMPSVDP